MNRTDKGRFESSVELQEHSDQYNQYAEWVGNNARKDSTEERLKAGVKQWLYWCESNDVEPSTAVEEDVRAYIQHLQSEDKAETTITRRVASVSKYYHSLKHDVHADWKIDENPTSRINLRRDYNITNSSQYVTVLAREGRDDILSLSKEDIRELWQPDAIPGSRQETRTRNELLIRIGYQTALRSDEISRIRCRNVDFENREITVRSSKLNEDEHPELYHRKVWWEPDLDLLMHRWEDSHRSQLNKKANDEYFFIGSDNGHEKDDVHDYQLEPSTISRIVKDAGHNAGIQEPLMRDADGGVKQWLVTAHRLRHSRITHLANYAHDGEGMDLNALRMMSGHAKFDTTLGYVQGDWDVARQRYRAATDSYQF